VDPAPSAIQPRLRLGPLLAGTLLLVIYAQLPVNQPFDSQAGVFLGWISANELRFWLAHFVFAVPGFMLLALGLEPRLRATLQRTWRALDALSPRAWLGLSAAFAAVLVGVAVAGRSLFLLDLPITDDELAVDFGARILARGRLAVPVLQPDGSFTQIYTHRHGGLVTSFDYPGVLLFRALSLATRLDSLLYAVASALNGVVVAAIAGRLLGRRGAWLAGLFWLCSPMVQTLSMTTHAHVASRLLLSVALYAYVALCTGGEPRRCGILLGLATGAAFATRTPETVFIMMPVALHLLWRAARERGAALRAVLSAVPPFLLFVGLYAAYNDALSGVWFLPARFTAGATEFDPMEPQPLLTRLGDNLGQNLMLLVVMGLGPLGALLAIMGIRRDGPTLTLGAALGSLLSLSLFHDNVGIHTVGPIHLSDCVPIVVVLAAVGTVRAFDTLSSLGLPRTPAAAALAAYAGGGLTLFTLVHGAGLQRQSAPHAIIRGAVRAAGAQDGVVIGESPAMLVRMRPEFAGTGSWVYRLPHPDPFLEQGPFYVSPPRSDEALARLRARFPNRPFFRLVYNRTGPFVRLERVP